jgi:hypothetical protein
MIISILHDYIHEIKNNNKITGTLNIVKKTINFYNDNTYYIMPHSTIEYFMNKFSQYKVNNHKNGKEMISLLFGPELSLSNCNIEFDDEYLVTIVNYEDKYMPQKINKFTYDRLYNMLGGNNITKEMYYSEMNNTTQNNIGLLFSNIQYDIENNNIINDIICYKFNKLYTA